MSRQKIPDDVQQRVREAAGNQCGYCQSQQQYQNVVFQIEHIIPLSQGGTNDESNLWLACATCNQFKGNKLDAPDPKTGEEVRLFNPRIDNWSEHFYWEESGTMIGGITAIGRATVDALRLNISHQVIARGFWVEAGWHPPNQ